MKRGWTINGAVRLVPLNLLVFVFAFSFSVSGVAAEDSSDPSCRFSSDVGGMANLGVLNQPQI
jgi:hypothetical protein